MRIGILGPLQVAGVAVNGARVRALLVRLALDPGRVVTADQLIGDLWPDETPAHPVAALQSLVSRARREAPGIVSSRPAGYALDVPAGEVDAWEFERLVRAGEARAALRLWRGAALADVAGLPFAAGPAARLEELRLTALATRIATDLTEHGGAGGRVEEVVAELRALVAEHPLREPFHALLVRALTAAGRRGEALEAFERARAGLADELGADPGAELRQAHLAALRDSPPEAAGPPESARGGRLPARVTSFVGRSGDLSRLRALLTAAPEGDDGTAAPEGDDGTAAPAEHGVRLVTLVGPGGAGKTRLAVEAAATLGGAVWLVELAAASGVLDSLEGVLRTTDPVTALRSFRRPLVVLDNCEHLIDEAARVTQRLLGAVPELRVLATSREPLDIPGETLHRVLPLEEAAAVELFQDRAAAARPDVRVEAGDAARICRELDGVPLAIELAAARLRTMSVPLLMSGLGDRLSFRGGRTAEPRHRTLRAVIDWSWELLSDAERELLRAFTVFAGGADAEAVARICGERGGAAGSGGEGGVLEVLASLVDKSLIGVSGDRYTMLETIRQYAAADLPHVRRAHARHYTALAEAAGPGLRTGGQLHWLAVLDAEQGNLDAALEHTDDPLRLLLARLWPWIMRGRRREAAERAAEVLRRVGDVPPEGRELAHGLCRVIMGEEPPDAVRLSDHPAAVTCFALIPAPLPGSVRLAEEAAERLRDHPDPWTRAAAALACGLARFEFGSAAEAGEPLRTALAGFRETGDRWGLSFTLHWLSLAAENEGDHAEAVALAREGERLAGEIAGLESPAGPMLFLSRLGRLQARTGDLAGAVATLARAEEVASGDPGGDAVAYARVLHARAEVARRSGDPGAAARLLHRALELLPGAPAQFEALVHVELARVSADPWPPLRRALELMAASPDRTVRATVLEGTAEHCDPELAAELAGAAGALRGGAGAGDPALLARCRHALGEAGLRRALTRGAAIPHPERYALHHRRSPP
ncbi:MULTISPECIES: BTAD domain-containing putative transcriptional regulator [unclassified Nonomuraea]|uniref:AfsR/SARP family transcriptional regulator n=1 Tax=unclassified Nonomuraea TaxID=2593643 RepID=UPI0033F3A860